MVSKTKAVITYFFVWIITDAFGKVAEGVGGKTVFPEDGFSQTPVEGTALLYRSKTELLHYSEAMKGTNEKWIMQLLLDYNHDFKVGDTITDFQRGTSYVWDGTK